MLDYFRTLDKPVVMMGESALMYQEEIRQAGGNIVLAPPHVIMPRAASVGALGCQMLDSGIKHDVMTLEPLYIRRSEAEELWERRNGICG